MLLCYSCNKQYNLQTQIFLIVILNTANTLTIYKTPTINTLTTQIPIVDIFKFIPNPTQFTKLDNLGKEFSR